MSRGAALTQAVLIGIALVAVAAGVAGLPRVRPDTIQIALHHDGAPLKAVPVWLTSEPQGNPHCQAQGLRGRTDARGRYVWERRLPEQLLLGFGRLADEIVVCAQIEGRQIPLWKRSHLGERERMNLSCDAASTPAYRCEAQYDVTLGQTLYLTVMALLAAMLVRVFWYGKSESVSLVALVFLLTGIFGCSVLFNISMSQHMQRVLTMCVGGALAGLHYALSQVFRETEEAAQAPETGFSGSSNP